MHGAFASAETNLVDCRKNYSFYFDLNEKELVSPNPPLHRICTLMRKMGVEALLREELVLSNELNEERDAYAIRIGSAINTSARAVRFTFFRRMPASGDWKELCDDDIMGYAVILTLKSKGDIRSYVYEAVVRPPSLYIAGKWRTVSNYYVHCSKVFETTVGTISSQRKFTFLGTFFCQQNGLTHICAHAALRIALNNWPTYVGKKITSKIINDALGIDHTADKQIPDGGLNAQDIQRVVQKLGHQVFTAEFIDNPGVDYDEFVYPLIESSCPVVLGIVKKPDIAHVVAVLGHTLNSDRWADARHTYGAFPRYPYIPTASWVDHFIFSDDNFGMYMTLPTEGIRNLLVPKHNPNLHAAIAVGLTPLAGKISGYLAEQMAATIGNNIIISTVAAPSNRWLTHLQIRDSPRNGIGDGQLINPIVCRTLMCAKTQYVALMTQAVDERNYKLNPGEIELLNKTLPDRFWVTEITIANLYSGNKRKLGDIITIINPTDPEWNAQEYNIFAWLTGICWHGPRLKNGPVNWSIKGHIPLIRGIPLQECENEW
jgi:hypothetical protein